MNNEIIHPFTPVLRPFIGLISDCLECELTLRYCSLNLIFFVFKSFECTIQYYHDEKINGPLLRMHAITRSGSEIYTIGCQPDAKNTSRDFNEFLEELK